MKLIIAGSRTIDDYNLVLNSFHKKYTLNEITEIVSGNAKGVDRIGEWIGEDYGIEVKKFEAQWDKFGNAAGYIRNLVMGKYADALLAIWDGRSKGTKMMIDIMRKLKKPFVVIRTDEDKPIINDMNSLF